MKKSVAFVAMFVIFALSTWALAAGSEPSGVSSSSAGSQASASSASEGDTGDLFSESGWLLLAGAAAACFTVAVIVYVKGKKAQK